MPASTIWFPTFATSFSSTSNSKGENSSVDKYLMAFGMLYSADVLGLACLSGFKIRVAGFLFFPKTFVQVLLCREVLSCPGFTDIPPPGSTRGLGNGGVCSEPGAGVAVLQNRLTCSWGSRLSVRFYSSGGYLKHSSVSSGFFRWLFTHYCDTEKRGIVCTCDQNTTCFWEQQWIVFTSLLQSTVDAFFP